MSMKFSKINNSWWEEDKTEERIEKWIEIITELGKKPAPKLIPVCDHLKMLMSDDVDNKKAKRIQYFLFFI